MTLLRLSLLLALVGGLLLVAGLVIGGDTSWFGIEGATFTRDAGTPAYAGAFETTFDPGGPRLLSVHDGNLWLGAGIALLLAALGTAVAHQAGLRLVRATASP